MRLLASLLLLGACTTPRTEVMIGIATDIPASGMNQIDIKVFREGVLEFTLPSPLRIQGPTGGDYDLPASFGVYSDDGSEPTITVEITGLLNDSPVVLRRSTFGLRKEQTLYMRMALLRSCVTVWQSCEGNLDQSMTCLQGACTSAQIDVHSFNDYAAGDERLVSCGNGTLIDTKTGQNLPASAPKPSCGTCIEDACYK
jgi:hypothetical protein